jgi:cytochrome c biogenesis protein CcmG/thiol:disulfide interchange protein DsbE
MHRLLFVLPVLAFVALGTLLWVGLGRDPSLRSSPLEGRPVPEFALPPLPDRGADTGLAAADLTGAPSLVNVFASWCAPCRVEHPLLTGLAEDGVAVHGIVYKDEPAATKKFLADLGDPYRRIGVDADGRVGIDWGVTGVPETFVIDAEGNIVHRHVGPLSARDLNETVLPMLEGLGS